MAFLQGSRRTTLTRLSTEDCQREVEKVGASWRFERGRFDGMVVEEWSESRGCSGHYRVRIQVCRHTEKGYVVKGKLFKASAAVVYRASGLCMPALAQAATRCWEQLPPRERGGCFPLHDQKLTRKLLTTRRCGLCTDGIKEPCEIPF